MVLNTARVRRRPQLIFEVGADGKRTPVALTNGVTPGNDLLLEVLLAPVVRLVGAGFCWFMDRVVKSHAAKRRKQQ